MYQKAHFQLRNQKGKVVGCICILQKGIYQAFGLSLKSKQDKFNTHRGIFLAENRAKRTASLADSKEHEIYLIRKEAIENLHNLCLKDFTRVMTLFGSSMYGWPSKGDLLTISYKKAVSLFCN